LHPAATPTTKLAVTITLAVRLSRPFTVPPLVDRAGARRLRPAGEGSPYSILLLTGGIDFKYFAMARRSALVRSLYPA